jgi:protein TonB
MFEDSLMESGGRIKTKSKYWMIATFAFNGVILAAMVLFPLLYPEALPHTALTAMISAPPPPTPPPPPPPPQQIVKPIKMVSEIDAGLHAPTKIPKDIKMLKEEAAPQMAGVAGMSGMGSASGVPGGVMGGIGNAPAPVVKVAPPKGPQRVSSGVMQGSKLSGSNPTYPPIARAAHVSGAVVLHAVISKTGTIERLEVISGPEMLRSAATEAVQNWRYKPYLLNGEPTEVDTQITVNFNFGGG